MSEKKPIPGESVWMRMKSGGMLLCSCGECNLVGWEWRMGIVEIDGVRILTFNMN